MQPVIRRSGFVHQMRVLSPEFPRYLSHSINIASHAQCPEHDHRDVYGWNARNLQREPCISHDGRGKIAKLVVARRLEAQKADPRCTCPHCDRGTASPAPQCVHRCERRIGVHDGFWGSKGRCSRRRNRLLSIFLRFLTPPARLATHRASPTGQLYLRETQVKS